MHLLIIGNEQRVDECKAKFGQQHTYEHGGDRPTAGIVDAADVVFDFTGNQTIDHLSVYGAGALRPVFVNTSCVSLKQLNQRFHFPKDRMPFGFAGLPGFLNREILEVSIFDDHYRSSLEVVCDKLKTDFQIVSDSVGMVTPRVICMIINEAYCTFEGDTASRQDIDLAMKLGTNYPFGPFEWSLKIGIRNVYELLSAVFEDTKNERYRISPLLKKEAFSQQ